ncbi:hypothetical protein [Hwangdonia sp.]|uniref:hypothetical protein n=1 Tax=Hwangdonia sp. TaxID=1883432 RepID=UPI003AB32CB1
MKLYNKIILKTITFYVLCAITLQLNAQSKNVNDGYITFMAPSSNFIDVEIEAHNGLPRFGDLLFKKINKELSTQKAFEELVKMKYMSVAYSDMDKNKLTKKDYSQAADKKVDNSVFAQSHLLRLAGLVCSEMVLEKYFCDDSSTQPCSYAIGKYGERPKPSYWGGVRNFNVNEFKQHRSYTSFTKDILEELQTWSQTFFPKDELIAYYVSKAGISAKFGQNPYDFNKKGYFIFNPLNGKQFLHSSWFEATDENEKKLKHSSSGIFLPMAVEKAKALKFQKGSPIFLVYKVKIKASEDTKHNKLKLSFSLESRIIEVYKDKTLTQKIGEISVDNLNTK